MEIAQTILKQLGGTLFVLMTGSKNFVADANSLSFKIGSGAKNGITHVMVILEANDTYTVKFMRVRALECRILSTFEDIYADRLTDLFTEETGFYTRF